MTRPLYGREAGEHFEDPRAPSSPPRPRKLYRSKGTCPDCAVVDGEVHLETCEQRSRIIG